MRRTGFVLLSSLLICPLFAFMRSASDGVYSKQQATRGQTAYNEQCQRCHGEALNGGEASPALAGAEFLGRWNGKSVADLYDVIKKTMPTDDPGSVSTRQTADITAYILSVNKFPAGSADLSNDPAASRDISIAAK